MGELRNLRVIVQTRDDDHAASNDELILFVADQAIGFGRPPPGTGRCELYVSSQVVSFDPFGSESIALGVSGNNAWGPREAVVQARYRDDEQSIWRRAAIAVGYPAYGANPDPVWVSQDTGEGVARWDLARFTPARSEDYLSEFLLFLRTGRGYAETAGPLDLLVHANVGQVPVLAYQATLPRMGQQDPGRGDYIFRFRFGTRVPGIRFSSIDTVAIVNRSDDAWGAVEPVLFGWGFGPEGQLRGGQLNLPATTSLAVVSQERSDSFPSDAPETGFRFGWSAPIDALRLNLLSSPMSI